MLTRTQPGVAVAALDAAACDAVKSKYEPEELPERGW
jgi:hypothetical protein